MRIRSLSGVAASLPLLLLTLLALGVLALGATPAASETERTDAGRSARTGPKSTQSRLDEIALDIPRSAADRETGRTIRSGRHLQARPTEEVSVGIVGCPGCTILLEALGGVFIERDAPRSGRR